MARTHRPRPRRPLQSCAMSGSTFAYFSPCPRGLEGALARELNALSAADVRTLPGGVSYRGDRACGYRVNLWSRIASRVLREAAASTYRGEEDIYKFARGLPWSQWFSVER